MHFPSVSMGAFTSNNPLQTNFTNAELPKFRTDLRTRLSHRTYLIQERLIDLERTLAQLQDDAGILTKHKQGHALAEIYRTDLGSALIDVVRILEDTLSSILDNQASDSISVDLAMFIGRFILHLGTSTVFSDLDSAAIGE
jgi:hypothetical protein